MNNFMNKKILMLLLFGLVSSAACFGAATVNIVRIASDLGPDDRLEYKLGDHDWTPVVGSVEVECIEDAMLIRGGNSMIRYHKNSGNISLNPFRDRESGMITWIVSSWGQ